MTLILTLLLNSLLLFCVPVYAQEAREVIVDYNKTSLPVLNDQLRRTSRRLSTIENGLDLAGSIITGILPIRKGGTGEDFSAGATGDTLYFGSDGDLDIFTPGTSGKFLKSNGAGYLPEYDDPGSNYVAGTGFIEAQANTVRSTSSTTYVKLKEFTPITRKGTIYIQWEAQGGGGANYVRSKVYVNDIAVGTEKTSNVVYETESESSISVNIDDVVQIYCKKDGGADCDIKNAVIKVTNPTIPVEASGY